MEILTQRSGKYANVKWKSGVASSKEVRKIVIGAAMVAIMFFCCRLLFLCFPSSSLENRRVSEWTKMREYLLSIIKYKYIFYYLEMMSIFFKT